MFCMKWRSDQISASVGIEPTLLGQIARTLITFNWIPCYLCIAKFNQAVCMLHKQKQPAVNISYAVTWLSYRLDRWEIVACSPEAKSPAHLRKLQSFAQGDLRDTSAVKRPDLDAHHSSLSSAEIRYVLIIFFMVWIETTRYQRSLYIYIYTYTHTHTHTCTCTKSSCQFPAPIANQASVLIVRGTENASQQRFPKQKFFSYVGRKNETPIPDHPSHVRLLWQTLRWRRFLYHLPLKVQNNRAEVRIYNHTVAAPTVQIRQKFCDRSKPSGFKCFT